MKGCLGPLEGGTLYIVKMGAANLFPRVPQRDPWLWTYGPMCVLKRDILFFFFAMIGSLLTGLGEGLRKQSSL